MSDWRVLEGDCVDVLRQLDAGSVQTCVTSPPYWGLRDYGTATWEGGDPECDHRRVNEEGMDALTRRSTLANQSADNHDYHRAQYRDTCGKCGAKRIDSQLGLEPTPEQYVENLVAVFREIRRVLRDDGTVWLNLGDSYASGEIGRHDGGREGRLLGKVQGGRTQRRVQTGLKPKDLVGIPWRVAFALQADGWWLRSDIIWAKPNPMPESVTDRPTRSHEYIFLLTKSARYYYDADAIREDSIGGHGSGQMERQENRQNGRGHFGTHIPWEDQAAGRNRRSVWTVTTQPFPGAHFATFPPKLIEPCVLAGSPPKCCGECGAPLVRVLAKGEVQSTGGSKVGARASNMDSVSPLGQDAERSAYNTGEFVQREHITLGWEFTCDGDDEGGRSVVLDPFAGAGTTGIVALRHGREFVGVELNPEYAEMARDRIRAFEANPNGYLDAAEPVPGQLELLGD